MGTRGSRCRSAAIQGEEAMNALNIRLKRVRSNREAVGLGFFYVGMLAFFIYALVSLVRSGLL